MNLTTPTEIEVILNPDNVHQFIFGEMGPERDYFNLGKPLPAFAALPVPEPATAVLLGAVAVCIGYISMPPNHDLTVRYT